MRRRAKRRTAVAAAVVLATAVAGCGVGAGKGSDGVTLTVTRDFGGAQLGRAQASSTPGGETVMRFLQRSFNVQTRYGGGFVQSINGVSSGQQGGRRVDWFYYVNGIEASRGAAATALHRGDRVRWDHHDWGAAMRIPAIVGSFPEPFRSGSEGKRLPVRIECADGVRPACEEVARRLKRVGVVAATSTLGAVAGRDTLRLLVGTWPALRRDAAARQLDRGPAASGVFARFDADGRRLVVLDPRGRPGLRLDRNAGLVAATRFAEQQPTWLVTGTDLGGVLSAAGALDERTLADRFALATSVDARLPVPAQPSR